MMNNLSLAYYNKYHFSVIKNFSDLIRTRKCVYYASDFLQLDVHKHSAEVEDSVQRTLEVFKTLDVSTEEHFFVVYRCDSNIVYKDWRLSELACLYMMVDGDPTDLQSLAHQQTELIDQILERVRHNYQLLTPELVQPGSQGRY